MTDVHPTLARLLICDVCFHTIARWPFIKIVVL